MPLNFFIGFFVAACGAIGIQSSRDLSEPNFILYPALVFAIVVFQHYLRILFKEYVISIGIINILIFSLFSILPGLFFIFSFNNLMFLHRKIVPASDYMSYGDTLYCDKSMINCNTIAFENYLCLIFYGILLFSKLLMSSSVFLERE